MPLPVVEHDARFRVSSLREVTSCRATAVNSHLTIQQVRSGIVARNVTDIDVSEGFTALVYSSSILARIVTAGRRRSKCRKNDDIKVASPADRIAFFSHPSLDTLIEWLRDYGCLILSRKRNYENIWTINPIAYLRFDELIFVIIKNRTLI